MWCTTARPRAIDVGLANSPRHLVHREQVPVHAPARARRAGLKDLQFRDVRKAAVNEAKKLGRNAQEFAGHSDPRTTEKHYLNEPVVVKPIC